MKKEREAMNNCVLIGRLVRDPETRYSGETTITNFTLAVDRVFSKDKEADFIRIVSFNKTAELCERYLAKGRQVAIQGRINTGSYENKEGQKVYTTDVIADRVKFLGSKGEEKKEEGIPEGFAALDEDEFIPF